MVYDYLIRCEVEQLIVKRLVRAPHLSQVGKPMPPLALTVEPTKSPATAFRFQVSFDLGDAGTHRGKIDSLMGDQAGLNVFAKP